MKWKQVDLFNNKAVHPSDLFPHFQADETKPVAILIDVSSVSGCEDEESYGLLSSIGSYEGLTLLLCKGCGESWTLGLAACVDIVIAATNSSFTLDNIGEKTAGVTAVRLAHSIGKARAMQILADGGITAERLQSYGIVSKLVQIGEIARPEQLIDDLFSENTTAAAVRLKRTWLASEGRSIEEAMAAERIEFQRCFREGAAAEIAEYLSNRKKAERE